MIHVLVLGSDGLQAGGAELLEVPGPKWIDLEKPDEAVLGELAARYGLHRLAVEDCLHLDQRPKLEEYPGHQFVVLQGFSSSSDNATALTLHELHVFLASDWVLTVHEFPTEAILAARARVRADPQATIKVGVDFVFYLVADGFADRNFPVIDRLNEELEELELEIFERPNPPQLRRAFELKRTLLEMRKVLSPQRDVVGMLARRGLPQIQDRTTLYFRDVYDHLVRTYEQIDAARDLVGNVTEAYLSVVANRTNDITKQLTIFAAIFLPLSFLVGFFGQNFEVLSKPGFLWAVLASTALVPSFMLWWFRFRRWL